MKTKVNAWMFFEMLQKREIRIDRKSTRLNSSHLVISYAVLCLKNKKGRVRAKEPTALAGRAGEGLLPQRAHSGFRPWQERSGNSSRPRRTLAPVYDTRGLGVAN